MGDDLHISGLPETMVLDMCVCLVSLPEAGTTLPMFSHGLIDIMEGHCFFFIALILMMVMSTDCTNCVQRSLSGVGLERSHGDFANGKEERCPHR